MSHASLSKDAFAEKVRSLMAGNDSTVVQASALVDFEWQSLCFERDDTLLLRFRSTGPEQVLSLPYTEFFVDEGYVAGSLEDECITPADRVLIRKKYPGHDGPIEFRKAPQGA